jgi:hypothetical protein
MSCMTCVAFVVGAGGGEKTVFSVSVLLAFVVLQGTLASEMPKSNITPIFTWFTVLSMASSTAAVLFSAFSVAVHHSNLEMPGKMRNYLSIFQCMLGNDKRNDPHIEIEHTLLKAWITEQCTRAADSEDDIEPIGSDGLTHADYKLQVLKKIFNTLNKLLYEHSLIRIRQEDAQWWHTFEKLFNLLCLFIFGSFQIGLIIYTLSTVS